MDCPSRLSIISLCLMMMALSLNHNTARAQVAPEDFLDAHNVARKAVHVPRLIWNDTLAEYAQQYAHERSQDCAMVHSEGPYGENLAAASWVGFSAKEAVDLWLSERKIYDKKGVSCIETQECGHYTQVLWRESARLGCAAAPCKNGWVFITCYYDPPGNFLRERPF